MHNKNINKYTSYGKYAERKEMIENQLKNYGIEDKNILDAFLTIPRHIFIPKENRPNAYWDGPQFIGYGQTISQPYIIALMFEEVDLNSQFNVLEIGSGSGYVCALLSLLVKNVTGIEIEKRLIERSITTLEELEIKNVSIYNANGYNGFPNNAPYDVIMLSAAPNTAPNKLFTQLKPDGKLILPVGKIFQELLIFEKKNGKWVSRKVTDVRFVPLRRENK